MSVADNVPWMVPHFRNRVDISAAGAITVSMRQKDGTWAPQRLY
jgi:hypothetical protein